MDAAYPSTDECPTLDSRIDWLTATAKEAGKGPNLLLLARGLAAEEEARGNRRKPWTFRGYAGHQTGHIRWGLRPDGCIAQVSGSLASAAAPAIAATADHVSRIDLAVTVRDASGDRDLAGEAWRDYLAAHTPGGPWPHALSMVKTDSGRTTYFGGRASALFRRIYDKHVESHGHYPEGCWRYELECKQTLAESLAAQVATGELTPGRIRGLVHRSFSRLDVSPAFSAIGSGELPGYRPRPPDIERSMEWLRTQVAPTVLRCVEWFGLNDVTSALGLPGGSSESRWSMGMSPSSQRTPAGNARFATGVTPASTPGWGTT